MNSYSTGAEHRPGVTWRRVCCLILRNLLQGKHEVRLARHELLQSADHPLRAEFLALAQASSQVQAVNPIITVRSYALFLQAHGHTPLPADVFALFRSHDSSRSGALDYRQYAAMVGAFLAPDHDLARRNYDEHALPHEAAARLAAVLMREVEVLAHANGLCKMLWRRANAFRLSDAFHYLDQNADGIVCADDILSCLQDCGLRLSVPAEDVPSTLACVTSNRSPHIALSELTDIFTPYEYNEASSLLPSVATNPVLRRSRFSTPASNSSHASRASPSVRSRPTPPQHSHVQTLEHKTPFPPTELNPSSVRAPQRTWAGKHSTLLPQNHSLHTSHFDGLSPAAPTQARTPYYTPFTHTQTQPNRKTQNTPVQDSEQPLSSLLLSPAMLGGNPAVLVSFATPGAAGATALPQPSQLRTDPLPRRQRAPRGDHEQVYFNTVTGAETSVPPTHTRTRPAVHSRTDSAQNGIRWREKVDVYTISSRTKPPAQPYVSAQTQSQVPGPATHMARIPDSHTHLTAFEEAQEEVPTDSLFDGSFISSASTDCRDQSFLPPRTPAVQRARSADPNKPALISLADLKTPAPMQVKVPPRGSPVAFPSESPPSDKHKQSALRSPPTPQQWQQQHRPAYNLSPSPEGSPYPGLAPAPGSDRASTQQQQRRRRTISADDFPLFGLQDAASDSEALVLALEILLQLQRTHDEIKVELRRHQDLTPASVLSLFASASARGNAYTPSKPKRLAYYSELEAFLDAYGGSDSTQPPRLQLLWRFFTGGGADLPLTKDAVLWAITPLEAYTRSTPKAGVDTESKLSPLKRFSLQQQQQTEHAVSSRSVVALATAFRHMQDVELVAERVRSVLAERTSFMYQEQFQEVACDADDRITASQMGEFLRAHGSEVSANDVRLLLSRFTKSFDGDSIQYSQYITELLQS